MKPSFDTLLAAKGSCLKGVMLEQQSSRGLGKSEAKGLDVTMTKDAAGNLVIEEAEAGAADQGVFIPWVPNKAVYFTVTNGATWLCSGPFSGCEFEIGNTADGLIYGAHIHMTSDSHLTETWDQERVACLGRTTNKFRRRISGPNSADIAHAKAEVEAGRSLPLIGSFAFVVLGGDLKDAKWYKANCERERGPESAWRIRRVERAQQETALINP